MVPVYRRPYEDGELWLGWPTWDERGEHGEMSLKYAYRLENGRLSRGCPEVPVRIAIDMVLFAGQHGRLTRQQIRALQAMLSRL